MFCCSHTNGGVRKTRLKMLMTFSLWKITSNIRQLVNSLDRWTVETNLRRKSIDTYGIHTTTTNSSTSGGSTSSGIPLLLPSDQLLLSILVGRKLFHCPTIQFTTSHIWMEYFQRCFNKHEIRLLSNDTAMELWQALCCVDRDKVVEFHDSYITRLKSAKLH